MMFLHKLVLACCSKTVVSYQCRRGFHSFIRAWVVFGTSINFYLSVFVLFQTLVLLVSSRLLELAKTSFAAVALRVKRT